MKILLIKICGMQWKQFREKLIAFSWFWYVVLSAGKERWIEHRGFLRQWKYSVWYYTDGFMWLYICPNTYNTLEKEMATHSSFLTWRIPWTEEPGRLQSIVPQRVGHDWVTNTGEGNGTPLQYSSLEKSHGRRSLVGCSPWGHCQSDTTEYFTFIFHFHVLQKEMAAHSSILAWRIPGREEPSGLPSMGSHRVGHDWSDLAAAAAAEQLTHTEYISPRMNCKL